jgi:hypothetical protein
MRHSEFSGVADAEEGQARWSSNNFSWSPFMRRVGGHVSVTSEWGRGTTVDLLFPSLEPVELPG